MTANRPRKTYQVPCVWGCGAVITTKWKPSAGGVGCGFGECLDKHNAAVEAAQAEAAARRAAARRTAPTPRRAQVLGEWGMAAQLGMLGRTPRG